MNHFSRSSCQPEHPKSPTGIQVSKRLSSLDSPKTTKKLKFSRKPLNQVLNNQLFLHTSNN